MLEYQRLYLFVRSQLKGVYLGLRKRQRIPPVSAGAARATSPRSRGWQEFSNYEALRGAGYTAYFDKLALLDVRVPPHFACCIWLKARA